MYIQALVYLWQDVKTRLMPDSRQVKDASQYHLSDMIATPWTVPDLGSEHEQQSRAVMCARLCGRGGPNAHGHCGALAQWRC